MIEVLGIIKAADDLTTSFEVILDHDDSVVSLFELSTDNAISFPVAQIAELTNLLNKAKVYSNGNTIS
jgi:hypothetical protein